MVGGCCGRKAGGGGLPSLVAPRFGVGGGGGIGAPPPAVLAGPFSRASAAAWRSVIYLRSIGRGSRKTCPYQKIPFEPTMEIKGRGLVAGVPETIETDEKIREALMEAVRQVVESVRIALERTPPELASDIMDKGIVLGRRWCAAARPRRFAPQRNGAAGQAGGRYAD